MHDVIRPSDAQMTVLEALAWATCCLRKGQIENPRLNAELLLARSLNLSREELYVCFNDTLEEKGKEVLERLIERRISGEPLQYLLGHQEFWSIDLQVDPRVLIPRPETELLVEQALLILSKTDWKKRPLVLDMGTGSGAIAVSLARETADVFLVATDISIDALFLAKENAKLADVSDRIGFVNGDLLAPFGFPEEGPFDLILSNPPYVSGPEIKTLPREVRDHEPIVALDGGEDGLDFYRRITSEASFYLRQGGWLLLEVGQGQAAWVSGLIEESKGFLKAERLRDLSGIERIVKAQKARR